ncbi:hypothetical protein BGZ79_009661 [Entomortierella chlamydospora]|nr:hypothetical protein BGZ79_009661 [Entomortierella chlamydospora]
MSQLSELFRQSSNNPHSNSSNLDGESSATVLDEIMYPGDEPEGVQSKSRLFDDVSFPGDGDNAPLVNTDIKSGLHPIYINNTIPSGGRLAPRGSWSSSPMTPVSSLASNMSSPNTYYGSFSTTPGTPTPSISSGSHCIGDFGIQGCNEPVFQMDVDLPYFNQSSPDSQLTSTQLQQQNAAQTQECPSIHTGQLEGTHQQTFSTGSQQAEQLQMYQQPLLIQGLCTQQPGQLQSHSHVVNESQQTLDFQSTYTDYTNQVLIDAPSFIQAPVPPALDITLQDTGMPPSTRSSEVLHSVSRSNSTQKRQRNALTMEEKVEIIDFSTLNPLITVKELSKKFGVPRSTIYGIFEKKEKITELARSQPNLSRVVENRFKILEALLIDWNRIHETRGIKISIKKLCAQAFEIHRMLSGLLSEPLPQCQFTTGWHKGFKERRAAHFKTTTISQEPPRLDEIKSLLGRLKGISKDNIYSCDIANMYLDMIPTSIYKDRDPSKPSRRTDSSMRQTSNAMGLQGYNGIVLDSDLEDVTHGVVWNWLKKFDREIGHKVVLLVDQAMYDLLELEKDSGQALLRFVTVLCIPRSLDQSLPMNARIVRDFKCYYYTLLLKDSPEWYRNLESQRVASEASHASTERRLVKSSRPFAVCPLNTMVSQLRIIPNAWLQVSASVVENDFQYFLDVAGDLARGDRPKIASRIGETDSAEGVLKETLATVCQELPSSVTQYYLSLGNEVGPSCFLRSRILEMRHHVDFQGCFGKTLNFGTVRFGSRKLESGVRFESTKQKQMAHKECDLLEEYLPLNFPFGGHPRHTREESSEVVMYGPQRWSTFGH